MNNAVYICARHDEKRDPRNFAHSDIVTVAQMIERLKECDPDKPVFISFSHGYSYAIPRPIVER